MLKNLRAFQVDAFTENVFGGNPAVVVMLEANLPDQTLLKIAQENAVSETAFLLRKSESYQLRWFTPDIEMDLCGHATLASAHVLFAELGYPGATIDFETLSRNQTHHDQGYRRHWRKLSPDPMHHQDYCHPDRDDKRRIHQGMTSDRKSVV